MVGIYKITNIINNNCYVGQSRNIKNRWKCHQTAAHNPNDSTYEYPLYRAMRKYGMQAFEYTVLEECPIEELNNRETYWIKYYHPEYNQTIGGDYQVIPQKLTYEQVQEIQQILINDVEGKISHKELGEQYGVSGKDTIRDINVGRTWYNPNLHYPLHYSKNDPSPNNKNHKTQAKCIMCGATIWYGSTYCQTCTHIKDRKVERPSRDQLKELIRTLPFTTIGKQFNVTDNAIRKWCKNENLPTTKKEINSFSDIEWENI